MFVTERGNKNEFLVNNEIVFIVKQMFKNRDSVLKSKFSRYCQNEVNVSFASIVKSIQLTAALRSLIKHRLTYLPRFGLGNVEQCKG